MKPRNVSEWEKLMGRKVTANERHWIRRFAGKTMSQIARIVRTRAFRAWAVTVEGKSFVKDGWQALCSEAKSIMSGGDK